MYLHVNDHIRLACYNDEMVLFDLRKDKFIILNKNVEKVITFLLSNEIKHSDSKYCIPNTTNIILDNQTFNDIIRELLNQKVFNSQYYNIPSTVIIRKKESTGAFTGQWKLLDKEIVSEISFFDFVKNLYFLLKARIYTKVLGINYLIKEIKKYKYNKYIPHCEDSINNLIYTLNEACIYFPTKTKCLEWSTAFMFLAKNKHLKCNLVIGVQITPFLSHAWIEIKNKPLLDSVEIANNTVIILREPFTSDM